jgi:hypothetical protein
MIQHTKSYTYEEFLQMHSKNVLPAIKIEFCTENDINYALRYLMSCTGLKIDNQMEISLYIARKLKNLLISDIFEAIDHLIDGKLKIDKMYSLNVLGIAQIINSYTVLKRLQSKDVQTIDPRLNKLTEKEQEVFNDVQKLQIEFRQKIENYGSTIRLSFFEIDKNFTLLYKFGFIVDKDIKNTYKTMRNEFINYNTFILESDPAAKNFIHFSEYWIDSFEDKPKNEKLKNIYYVQVSNNVFEKSVADTVAFYASDLMQLQKDWNQKRDDYSLKQTNKKFIEIVKIFYANI